MTKSIDVYEECDRLRSDNTKLRGAIEDVAGQCLAELNPSGLSEQANKERFDMLCNLASQLRVVL
jgi:hypothetical protein